MKILYFFILGTLFAVQASDLKPLRLNPLGFKPVGFKPFFEDHARGWHWYEAQESEVRELQFSESGKEEAKQKKTAKQRMKEYQENLETALYEAILNPTPQNIQTYQYAQKEATDRSKTFSVNWIKNVLLDPQLDHTLVSPTNQTAVHIKNDLQKKQTHQTILNLSKEYGLFYFFSSTCAYCEKFAPIVAMFSQKYHWEVLAISVDGGASATFPKAVRDNGLYDQWKVEALPALFAVNPTSGDVIPLAYGLTALSDIEDRIMALVKGEKE